MTEDSPSPPSIKVKLTAYTLAILVVLGAISFAEYLLSKLWPITTAYRYSSVIDYEFRPNLDIPFVTQEFSTRIQTGADGLRAPAASNTGAKVLFMGDSFVFGHGVNGEQAIPHQLQALSNGQMSVVNAGVPGYDTRREALMLEQIEARISPDIIIVGFVLNDVLSNSGQFWFSPTATGLLRHLPFPALGSLVEYLLSDPAFVLFRLGVIVPKRFDHLACRVQENCQAGWDATTLWMTRLKAAARSAHLVLARIPMPGEIPGDDALIAKLHDIADKVGMDFVDVGQAPGLMESGYYASDGHWNPRGHHIAASYLLTQLTANAVIGK